jgi:cell division septum initiation protein DivIVA
MAEISVQFKNKINGYDKVEVQEYAKGMEARLQEKSIALANAQQKIEELEAKLTKITGADSTIEEKVELYDKLMKKMDGDYTNLLTPAIAKAKAIEEQAEKEYAIRIDQARYAAEGIYTETADRIAGVVDNNMDRLYNLLDEFLYSKTLPGRVNNFVKSCKALAAKIKEVPTITVIKVKETAAKVKEKFNAAKETAEAAE